MESDAGAETGMVALLDVNVLVALFDGAHTHHQAAHEWFDENRHQGWASCPITESGFVRVIANVAYPGRRTTMRDAIDRLRSFHDSGGHEFWADELSVCDGNLFSPDRIGGHRQMTDVYLLALAAARGGRLATFDRRISLAAASAAKSRNLVIIGKPRAEFGNRESRLG